jgi:3-hydroxyisobutyrate dehydrogenase
MRESVGFIGLGIMGMPMVRNLIRAGFEVTVYNRTISKAEPLIREGASKSNSPAELAKVSSVVITMVSDTADVERVILGENGIIECVKPDSVIIDMSTISPQVTKEIAVRLREKNVHMLDAPVSGGEQGAIDGTLSIMVGGDFNVFKRCQPILEAMGKNILHVGNNGMGQTVKLINQILVAGTLNSVVEALVFAQKQGVDLNRAIEAVKSGAAGSWQLTNLAPRIIERDFRPGFMVDLMQKDLRLVMEAAESNCTPLPVTSLIHQMFHSLQSSGEGKSGTQALVKIMECLSGIEVGQNSERSRNQRLMK